MSIIINPYRFPQGDKTSYALDGTGDWLGIPDHADWDLTADFTLEFWLHMADVTPAADSYIFSHYVDVDNNHTLRVNTDSSFTWRVADSGSVVVAVGSSASHLTNSTWHHIALVRSGDDYFIFIDGTDRAASGTPDTSTPATLAGSIFIGQEGDNSSYLTANLDEIRVSNTARYTSGFTPQTSQFTSDSNTKLLIHCGETKTGTTGSGATFTDSGNTGHTVTENGNAIEDTTTYKI